ncbi:MAG: family 78 glycoside hydrolase catalytic domain [Pirellulales bacterium]
MILSQLKLSLIAGALVLSVLPDATAQADISAKWIWKNQDSYTKYNDTVVARKVFTLPAATSANILITADTRYRLSINGQWVGDGPCRSWPDQYQYDVIDVTPYLKVGENEIQIVAKYFGIGTFHQIPQQSGLLAQLDVETTGGKSVRVITDGTWKTASASGWISNTVKRCIQMGPLEIYDARLEDSDAFAPAAVLFDAGAGPWKNLNPRDVALMTKIPFAFGSFREANVVSSEWRGYVFSTARLLYPGLIEANKSVSMASAVATVIDVPKATTLHLKALGCTLTIDGRRSMETEEKWLNTFELTPGKHFLFGVVSRAFGHWEKETEIQFIETSGYVLSNPINGNTKDPWSWVPFEDAKFISRDIEFLYHSAHPEEHDKIDLKIKSIINAHLVNVKDKSSFQTTFADQILILSSKTDVTEDLFNQFKEREVIVSAAKLVEHPNALLKDDSETTIIAPSPLGDVELIYDFGDETIGHFSFDIEAEAGLIVDVAAVEYITPKGLVQHTEEYRNAMRYICKEGNNKFLSLDRRAARYVFITLRNQTKPVSIRHFNIIESTYPAESVGTFSSSDTRLNKIFQAAVRTMELCMEDVYTDCPLYEQTLWTGDAGVMTIFGLHHFGAEDITRRSAWLVAQSVDIGPNTGEFPIAISTAPTKWEILLPAESFMWNLSVWDYYRYSGDRVFLNKVWPRVMKTLRSSYTFRDEYGLFSGPFWNTFDFAKIDRYHETVLYNSMFLVGAMDAALKCADALDDAKAIEWLKDFRTALVDAINLTWSEQKKAYPDSYHEDGSISTSTCMHTSFLSYLYDIVEVQNKDHVLQNMINPPENMVQVGSPFAIMYLYQALEKAGRQELIMKSILDNYVPMIDAGTTTVWESFPSGTLATDDFPTRSYCHAFSAAPIYFLPRIVLGIQSKGVGGKIVAISPRPSGLTWAKGAVATTHGPVDVSWKLDGDKLTIATKGPEGTDLRFKSNETLTHLNVLFNGQTVASGSKQDDELPVIR